MIICEYLLYKQMNEYLRQVYLSETINLNYLIQQYLLSLCLCKRITISTADGNIKLTVCVFVLI